MIDKREFLNSLYQKILIGDILERTISATRDIPSLGEELADSVMQPLLSRYNISSNQQVTVSVTGIEGLLGF